MKKTKTLTVVAAVLAAIMLLGSCAFLPIKQRGAPSANSPLPQEMVRYSEMEYKQPDVAALLDEIGVITQKVKAATTADEVIQLDDEISRLYDDFSAMYTLAQLKSYHDHSDEYYQEQKSFCADANVTLRTATVDLNRAIVEGKFADDYKAHVGDYVFESIKNQLRLHSKEVETLRQERKQLEIKYDKLIADATVTHNGTELTMDDLLENTTLQYIEYVALMGRYFDDNVNAFADIYSRLVALDKEITETLGFETAADMYYLSYDRDYTPAEGLALCHTVQELFAPMAPAIFGASYSYLPVKLNDALKTAPQFLKDVDAELTDAWQDMLYYELYDFEPLKNKQRGTAFTTTLGSYNAPFTYMYWEDDFASASTMLHEFGHFYDFWLRSGEDTVFNLDIAEVYSQGLEMLMYHKADYFTDQLHNAQDELLYNMANALIYQSLLEEFQFDVYAMEEINAETLSTAYTALFDAYGLESSLVSDAGLNNTWFQVEHLFQAPFYTVSYITSAVVALQIWTEALDDWRAAADTYLALIHQEQNQPFGTLIKSAGLGSPFDEAPLAAIADQYQKRYAGATLPNAA